jgi:tRNA(Arg) A34 adenosine deaminase TadA
VKDNEYYMQRAIEEARTSRQNGGVAIGAVVVDKNSGHIVSKGGSTVKNSHDPTAHAEINAIRQAAEIVKSDDLFGHVLFSTLEPCHMCLSAAAWARIPQLYFGAYKKDVDDTLFDIKGNFSDELEGARMNLRENLSMKVVGGLLEEQCADLLASYHDSAHHSSADSNN